MNRRDALKAGASLGALAGAGWLGRRTLLPPPRSERLAGVRELATRLLDGLEPADRAVACVDYDHPLRQYHNRGVPTGGLAIRPWSLPRDLRQCLTDLFHAGLSEAGRGRLPEEFFVRWTGVHAMNVLLCGDPRTQEHQLILSGPHVNLRIGGKSREGVAFGGPQVYGDQRGNERQGLPGNVFRFQFELACRLRASLRPEERAASLLERAPVQTQVEVQGRAGAFAGVAVARLGEESRQLAGRLVDSILSSYPPDDVAYARACLDHNGGLDALHLSYYAEGEVDGSGEYQIFRLEGPGTVLHFRGYPHVHAFVNVAWDAERPLSVGELLGENPSALEGPAVARLFERALRHQTGSDFASYDEESVAGRLRRGPIRSGDVYVLESWQNDVLVSELRGARLPQRFVDELAARGEKLDPARLYTVATTDYDGQALGRVASRRRGIPLREATIEYLREVGFGPRYG